MFKSIAQIQVLSIKQTWAETLQGGGGGYFVNTAPVHFPIPSKFPHLMFPHSNACTGAPRPKVMILHSM